MVNDKKTPKSIGYVVKRRSGSWLVRKVSLTVGRVRLYRVNNASRTVESDQMTTLASSSLCWDYSHPAVSLVDAQLCPHLCFTFPALAVQENPSSSPSQHHRGREERPKLGETEQHEVGWKVR